VRALLRVLVDKGFLKHRQDGPRYVYLPTVPREKASRSALKGVLKTFFKGSLANAVSSLVDARESKLSPEEAETPRGHHQASPQTVRTPMYTSHLALLELLLKGTAVLLAGYGATLLLVRASAAQRSLCWLGVFCHGCCSCRWR